MVRRRIGLVMWICAAVLLVACSGAGQPNVQATVDAAVAATAQAQTRFESTVAAAVAATQAAAGAAATPAVVAAATPTPAPPEPTTRASASAETPQAPVATATLPAAACTVITDRLNLRAGPGTVYAPVATLAAGVELRPLSFVASGFPSGSWIEVERATDRVRGWVSAGQQFVACNFDPATLPAGSAPPTPTPRPPTATPTSPVLPTATRVLVAVVPVDGSDGNRSLGNDRGVNGGRNIVLPGPGTVENGAVVFRDSVVFQVEVFDRNAGQDDGAGIREVRFTISDETGNVVHQRTERNAGYCVFGGGEPDCVIWRFSEHGSRWPGGAALQYGFHNVTIDIVPQSGQAVNWFWGFRIARP